MEREATDRCPAPAPAPRRGWLEPLNLVRWNRCRRAALLVLTTTVLGAPLAGSAAAGNEPGALVGIDAETGSILYQKTFGARNGASISVVGGAEGVAVVERIACYSDDRPYEHGDATLIGFDADTGEELWRREDAVIGTLHPVVGGPGASSLTFPGGPIAVKDLLEGGVLRQGRVTALDPRTGNALWSAATANDEVIGASHKLLLVAKRTSGREAAIPTAPTIRALDRRSGHLEWTLQLDRESDLYFISASTEFVTMVASRRGRTEIELVVLRSSDGMVIRTFPVPASDDFQDIPAAIASTDDRLIIDKPYVTEGLNAATGAVVWEADGFALSRWFRAAAHLHLTLVFQRESDLSAFDTRSGERLWSVPGSLAVGGQSGSIVGIELLGTGLLRGLSLNTGETLWEINEPKGTHTAVNAAGVVLSAGGCPLTRAD